MMEAKQVLSRITNKSKIFLVKSGNNALKQVINNYQDKTFLIQDQGGWITYKQFPKKIQELKTDYGLIQLTDILSKVSEDKICLINSMPGYFQVQDMESIANICRNKCLVINDVSGSFGIKEAMLGDIIVGSFGKHKIVNLEYGGFVATDLDIIIKENFGKDPEELSKKLKNVEKRRKSIQVKIEKIKEDLKNFKLINKKGLNIAVLLNSEKEKQEIIGYCNNFKYEYVECPKYIKIKENAISIEVKRK